MKTVFTVVRKCKWWDLINYFYILKAKLEGNILIYIPRNKYNKHLF